MGQSFSRRRNVESTARVSASVVAPQSGPIVHDEPHTGHAQSSQDIATSPSLSSRRSSIRQSIRSLISSKSSRHVRSHTESSTSHTRGRSSRKRWPTSRRWSVAPEELNGLPQETTASVPEGISEGSEAPVASSSTNNKERENVDADITPFDRRTSIFPIPGPSNPIAEASESDLAITEEEEQGTSSNAGTWMGGQVSLAQNLGLPNAEDDEVVISPTAFAEEQVSDTGAAASVDSETADEMPTPTQAVQDGQMPVPAPLPLPPHLVADDQPPRQFPPPGTLVVVQGVVHTTDVARPPPPIHAATPSPPNPYLAGNPRRASSYIPRTPTPLRPDGGFPRSRRSSVIPRPSSMRSRPASMLEGSTFQAPAMESSSDSEPVVSTDGDITPASSGSGSGTRTSVSSEPGTPVLSPSSIDVLGTLLSVAAAATAASLLTGSSDPIFTSGLNAPPNPNTTVPISTTNNLDRPTSPTPTASLGNFGSLSAGLGVELAEDAPPAYAGGRERMRHVWGSLRERLGRRTGGNGGANGDDENNGGGGSGNEQQPDITSQPGPNGTPIDAREIMLAEMARAFNLGLGLSSAAPAPDAGVGASSEGNNAQQENAGSSSTTSPAPGGAARPPELSLPAEGSFERFLVDLQADLRAALSAQDPPANQLPYTQRSDHETRIPDINSRPSIPSSSGPATVPDQGAQPLADGAHGHPDTSFLLPLPSSATDASPSSVGAEVDDDEDLPSLVSPSPTHITSRRQDDEAQGNQLPEGESLPLPASFRPVTRSDSESDAGGDLPEMSEAPRVPHNPSPSGAGAVVESGSISRTERRPGGGINWWRSYRFPPITAPHAHGPPTTLNSTNTTAPPLATTHPSDPASDTITPSPSVPLVSPSSPTQNPGPGILSENRPNVVVPVIVVGLQSVNMDRGRDQPPPFGDDPTFGANHNEPESTRLGGDMNLDGMPVDGDSPRARTWHSRAANAFRNLRAGRRASRVPQANEGHGSRTFLIYVIGGYYPPDHGLITGANALDSFEALWELAELLGQVRPQTVSKEQIDNSGLEIIQSTALEQYEKEGKVASNCLERCLICLDDYVPDIDLRLLNCKHAFHKNCVDQWFQTGKNNCPACRTKGVSSGPESTPSSAATSPV